MNLTNRNILFFACALLTVDSLLPLTAQTTNAAASTAPAATATGTLPPSSAAISAAPSATTAPGATMSTIVVTGVEQSALPTDSSVSSVFGNDLSVLDTPRSVSAISSELIQDTDIERVQDFSKLAPSSYTTDNYGGANAPTIRGIPGVVFQNGMERTTRDDGIPLTLNSVDSADVVNGPASSVYGPSAYTGGYLNVVTKQPYFDAFHSTTDFTVGSWDEYKWSEDIGGPIIPNVLAYRASYEGEDAGSHYTYGRTDTEEGFLALKYTPNPDFTVDFNSDFLDSDVVEIGGWNRVTQDLINTHTYVTGTAATPVVGNPYEVVIVPTGTTRLSSSTSLVGPYDSTAGKDYNAQMDVTYVANDNLTIVDRTYFEYLYERQYQIAQSYESVVDPSYIIQNRLEFHYNFDTPIIAGMPASKQPMDGKDLKEIESAGTAPLVFKSQITAGVALKYVNDTTYQDYYNEDDDLADLSLNGSTYEVPNANYPTQAYQVPIYGTNLKGQSGGFYSTGNSGIPGTLNQREYFLSPFFQHQIAFTDKLSMLYGGRADVVYNTAVDPLPQPGFEPVSAHTTEVMPSTNVSLTYKPESWATIYTTFAWSESAAFNDGGGIGYLDIGSTPNSAVMNAADYHYQNFLYEGGVKFDVLNHQLYASADVYYQTHNQTTTNFGGVSTSEIRTDGVEVSTTYQPDKHFYLTLNETYMNAVVVNPAGQDTESPGQEFTIGSPNFIAPPTGDYRESGLPQFFFTGQAAYTFDNGLGATFGYQITDPIPVTEVNPAWIPWQYELDASIFYKPVHQNYEARLNFFNITNQCNFSSGGYLWGTGADLITVNLPFHMEGTLTYKF